MATRTLVLTVLVLTKTCISASEACPNAAFRKVANYHEPFTLDDTHARYWVAYGYPSSARWEINLVSTKWKKRGNLVETLQTFKCKEWYWFDEDVVAEPKNELDRAKLPICCVAPHDIDYVEQIGKVETVGGVSDHCTTAPTQPFAVLPSTYYRRINTATLKPVRDRTPHANGWKFFAMKTGGKDKPFMKWEVLQFPSGQSETTRSDLHGSGEPFNPPHANLKRECSATITKGDGFIICDTDITADIVVFEAYCADGRAKLYFRFSRDGQFRFSKNKKLEQFCSAHSTTLSSVKYYSVLQLDEWRNGERQSPPSYNSRASDWRLASFCASCPGISFSMQISEKEAKSNKEAIQRARQRGAGIGATGACQASLSYTRTWIKEVTETLASGKATTISASCNAFYLWQWTIAVGTWGEGDAVVQTGLFYCTDRPQPPICKPRLSSVDDVGAQNEFCHGNDVEADFIRGSADTTNGWQSLHAGRPKTIRLQGQYKLT